MSRILVVEDSSAIRLLIRRRLEMSGHQVDDAPDGLVAIRRLEVSGPPDLLIVDATMPFVDGAGLLTRARRLWPDLPVVVVSARGPGESDPALDGADARLAKPIDFELLLATVDRLTG